MVTHLNVGLGLSHTIYKSWWVGYGAIPLHLFKQSSINVRKVVNGMFRCPFVPGFV